MTRLDKPSSLDLGIIGNCSVSALIDQYGGYVWSCLPHFAGDPAFCQLLEPVDREIGFMDVELDGFVRSEQSYIPNTPVLVTVLEDNRGGAVEITDFSPRFRANDRLYHPLMFVRIVRPLRGLPRMRFRVRPATGWGSARAETTTGSNHIRFQLSDMVMRLTTNVMVPTVERELPWVLEGPVALVLGPDETLTTSVDRFATDALDRTVDHWRRWSRSLNIPLDWQEAVIRAAITLKLSQYEGTGAIVAAMTTSIPEAANTERNWDYRYCWLRDAAYVVRALNGLGTTQSMEEYLRYVYTIASGAPDLQPVYGIHYEASLLEREEANLSGYQGMGPVRVGNDAWRQRQHDTYGSVVLASTHLFFDQRLSTPGDEAAFARLEIVGEKAASLYDQPDAGLWEYRGREAVHTYSSVMCWAACDRLARIAAHLNLADRATMWRNRADAMRKRIIAESYDEKRQTFVATWGGDSMDAALLTLHTLGFVAADDPRFFGTVAAIERDLLHGDYVFRYVEPDDFGQPETAFLLCTFWYIDALAALGRLDEARELFVDVLNGRNSLGLLSEDIEVSSRALWGNFPQTYSMVGIIESARRLSRPWEVAS